MSQIDVLPKNQFGQTIGFKIQNWQPRQLPTSMQLVGRYCILEKLDIEKHSTKLYENLCRDNHEESWTYLPYGPFATQQEWGKFLEVETATPNVIFYAILDAKNHIPIGICSYLNIVPKHGTIEIGHLHFSKFLKRTPAATETIYLMLSYIFEQHNYRRAEWKCNSLNEPSRKAAERFGFQFEGIFRQHYVIKGHNRDSAWYSILDQEWLYIKKKFEIWLDPNNFDEQGKQRLKLQEIVVKQIDSK